MSYVFRHFGPGFAWISIAPPVIFGIAGLVAVAWGLTGLMGKRDDGRVVFDRGQGLVVKKAREANSVASDDLRIRNVAAVQLCSGIIPGSEGDSKVFELNLVLMKPAGERIRLLGRMNEATIRADAQQLAKFLDVSLWDHTAH